MTSLRKRCLTRVESTVMKEALVFAAVFICCWVLQPSTCDLNVTNSTEGLNTTGLPTIDTDWTNIDQSIQQKWLAKLLKNVIIFGIVVCIIVAMFFLVRYYRAQRRTSRRKRYYQVSTSGMQDEEEADDEIEMSIYEKK